jgi:UDP-3-O-[3-hydroxymyristoyl] N-acetylglucosamine deacetylase
VTYVIDYPGTPIGTEMKDVIINSGTFMAEVAPARTFCLLSEVERLRESGLGLGGDKECVLVMGDGGSVGSEYRIDRECVSHKIADLLGDLALAGFVADAHYVCARGGHWLHAKLVSRLKRCVSTDLGR